MAELRNGFHEKLDAAEEAMRQLIGDHEQTVEDLHKTHQADKGRWRKMLVLNVCKIRHLENVCQQLEIERTDTELALEQEHDKKEEITSEAVDKFINADPNVIFFDAREPDYNVNLQKLQLLTEKLTNFPTHFGTLLKGVVFNPEQPLHSEMQEQVRDLQAHLRDTTSELQISNQNGDNVTKKLKQIQSQFNELKKEAEEKDSQLAAVKEQSKEHLCRATAAEQDLVLMKNLIGSGGVRADSAAVQARRKSARVSELVRRVSELGEAAVSDVGSEGSGSQGSVAISGLFLFQASKLRKSTQSLGESFRGLRGELKEQLDSLNTMLKQSNEACRQVPPLPPPPPYPPTAALRIFPPIPSTPPRICSTTASPLRFHTPTATWCRDAGECCAEALHDRTGQGAGLGEWVGSGFREDCTPGGRSPPPRPCML